jgi:hypothetical protein
MAKRVVLAGILGGIVMFFWGFVYHDLLPFGLVGLQDLPNTQTVLSALKTNIPEAGMYFFPGFGLPADAPYAQKKAAMQKLEQNPPSGPQGLLIYSPVTKPLSAGQLITECGTNIIQALLVAFLLAQTGLRRLSSRLGFATVMGVMAAMTTNVAFWNWYAFPANFIISNIAYLIVGYFLVGIVAAAMVKTGAPRAAAAAA